ncbi:hypothetical protein D046_1935B, partial [Vibrio parahaemolyticus V-223/04]
CIRGALANCRKCINKNVAATM